MAPRRPAEVCPSFIFVKSKSSYYSYHPQYSYHPHYTHSTNPSETQASTDQLIESLRTRRVNTLTELRRIERIAASSSDADQAKFQEPMTAAWKYYVDSNNLLNELRGLTRNYPFSSECLNEAKWLVLNDPESNRSWNVAWLVLTKIMDE
jgi:hypothetical protein